MRTTAVSKRASWRWAVAVAAATLIVVACVPPPEPDGGDPTTTTSTTVAPSGSSDSVTVDGETLTVEVSQGLTVSVEAAAPGGVPDTPGGFAFPFGALRLEVDGVEPGGHVRVEVTLTKPVDTVRKLLSGTWRAFDFDGVTGATRAADGRSFTIDLVDGGRGDNDGAADGRIVDPFAPADATSLFIPDAELPFMRIGQPYSHRLNAVGAAGPVTWSVIDGNLPPGITLGADGTLSGVAASPGVTPMVRVQADDGAAVATRQLYLFVLHAGESEIALSGVPLPAGNTVHFGVGACDDSSCSGERLMRYERDGAASNITSLSTAGVRSFIGGAGAFNADGTLLVVGTPTASGVVVVDAETGERVAALGDGPSNGRFSSGSYLTVTNVEGSTSVYDTRDWSVVRTILEPLHPAWSPGGTEFVSSVTTLPGALRVFSATDPTGASDRTLELQGAECGLGAQRHLDWSTTNRIAVLCDQFQAGARLITMHADGSDQRVVGAWSTSAMSQVAPPSFSPDGSHLAFALWSHSDDRLFAESQVVAVRDEAFATPVTLVSATDGVLLSSISWR